MSRELQAIVERLDDAVGRLEAEMRCLRNAVERVQDDIDSVLANDNRRQERSSMRSATPMHITSLPRDPLDPNFGERINRVMPRNSNLRAKADTTIP